MAQFTNQAQITYTGGTVTSNVAVGEITEVLSMNKTALSPTYAPGDTVTYVVNLINSGDTAVTGLSLTDNLGEYDFGTGTRVPLTFVDGALQYYADGVLQPDPAVTAGPPLRISGISVPANGNAMLLYQAVANQFAPPAADAAITNVVTATGSGVSPLTAEETITAVAAPRLAITKSISPVPVAENGRLTYTFLIQNSGTAAVATDDIVLTDLFDPILSDIAVTFEGETWTEGVEYTYNDATGLFTTTAGSISVPGATYAQDPTTGRWIITPGTATLTVVGTV